MVKGGATNQTQVSQPDIRLSHLSPELTTLGPSDLPRPHYHLDKWALDSALCPHPVSFCAVPCLTMAYTSCLLNDFLKALQPGFFPATPSPLKLAFQRLFITNNHFFPILVLTPLTVLQHQAFP